ncbi:MAG: dTDP-glucose 4,6-dehydratase [Candidatus Uhrbacteria bacterium]|nr:dTDP-glucose 4,6-dehydratase [Candidatus Uhrbacteria bacterium]
MRLLVTGGCGFMGSNFIRAMLQKYPDCSVCNLDALTYAGNPENLRDIENDPRYTFVHGRVEDEAVVEKVFSQFKPDCVLNYAAETHVDRSILEPRAFLTTEIFGTHTLLEAVRRHETSRYIQISTDEVYGSIEEGLFTELSPFDPSSPYSAAKAGADHLCQAYWKTFKTPVIVTHSCNFYGPYQYPEKMMPLFIINLLEGKKVPLYGDGLNVREWIYTEDHCRAVDLLIHKGVLGESYNIGTGERMTNIDLTHKILLLLGKGEEMIERVADRAGHDRRYAVDSSKLNALGWQPQCSFEEAFAKTVEWYKTHEAWWKPLRSGEYLAYYKRQYEERQPKDAN